VIVVDASALLELLLRADGAGNAPAPIERFVHEPLLDRVWSWRDDLSAYDATYVAMAELFDATLWTADRRLARRVESRVRVTVVGVT
jgi:predicted nucleic acid-binding protein